MKFVTLALAVLLAVGCQAASLQADAPAPQPLQNYVDQIRGYMRFALDQIKESAHRVADKISDEETKGTILNKVDAAHASILALQSQASPVTDGAVATIDEATRDLRTSILEDFANLQRQVEPMREKLRDVVNKHIEEYKTMMGPILQEYHVNQQEQMAAVKAKLEPLMDELRQKIETNVEETKMAMIPILEAVRARVSERMENVKAMVEPYVQEYKEQMKAAYSQAQNVDYTNVQEKLQPHMTALKENFNKLFEEVQGMMPQ